MRPKTLALLGVPVAAFCAGSYFYLDVPVARYCDSLGGDIKQIFEVITRLGKSTPYLIVTGLACIYFRFIRKNLFLATVAAFLFAAIALSGLANDLIKVLVGRSRPRLLMTEGLYGFKHFSHQYLYLSFPSGHATTIAALCYGLYRVWGRCGILYILAVLAVLASRVVIGAHFPSDVIFGAWLSILITELIRMGFEKKGILLRRSADPDSSEGKGAPSSGMVCFTGIRADSWKRILANIALLTIGNLIYAAGINSIIIPQHFLGGGVMGVALIAHYFIPALNTGYAYFLLNIPLFVLGWFSISRRFVLYSAYGMLSLSVITAFARFGELSISNPILAAILGGIVCGTGAGIALRSQGSAGGLDIVAIYLNQKFGLRIGNTTSAVSVMVLGAGAIFLNFEAALYSLIFVFTSGKALDAVLTGFNQKKTVFIISDCFDDIASQILVKLHRGVTYLDGRGGYSGQEKKVILSVITLTELSKLKQMVFDIDPTAFVVVNDTLEVIGHRHGELQNY